MLKNKILREAFEEWCKKHCPIGEKSKTAGVCDFRLKGCDYQQVFEFIDEKFSQNILEISPNIRRNVIYVYDFSESSKKNLDRFNYEVFGQKKVWKTKNGLEKVWEKKGILDKKCKIDQSTIIVPIEKSSQIETLLKKLKAKYKKFYVYVFSEYSENSPNVLEISQNIRRNCGEPAIYDNKKGL